MTRSTERKLASPPQQPGPREAGAAGQPEKDWKVIAEKATLHASVAG